MQAAANASGGDGCGGGVGGESGSPLIASSPSSTHLRRPPRERKNVPAPLTQWVWGSEEDDSRHAYVHWGGGGSKRPRFKHAVGLSVLFCGKYLYREIKAELCVLGTLLLFHFLCPCRAPLVKECCTINGRPFDNFDSRAL